MPCPCNWQATCRQDGGFCERVWDLQRWWVGKHTLWKCGVFEAEHLHEVGEDYRKAWLKRESFKWAGETTEELLRSRRERIWAWELTRGWGEDIIWVRGPINKCHWMSWKVPREDQRLGQGPQGHPKHCRNQEQEYTKPRSEVASNNGRQSLHNLNFVPSNCA